MEFFLGIISLLQCIQHINFVRLSEICNKSLINLKNVFCGILTGQNSKAQTGYFNNILSQPMIRAG